jgi:hypothetical protein
MASFDSFNGENEVGVGGDGSNGSAAVSSGRRAENFDFRSNIEMEADFVPADDNLSCAYSQGKGSSSVVTGVENLSSSELSTIVHFDRVTLARRGALLSLLNDFDAIFAGEIFGEKGGAEHEKESQEDGELHE